MKCDERFEIRLGSEDKEAVFKRARDMTLSASNFGRRALLSALDGRSFVNDKDKQKVQRARQILNLAQATLDQMVARQHAHPGAIDSIALVSTHLRTIHSVMTDVLKSC